jgi:hypothetical protein
MSVPKRGTRVSRVGVLVTTLAAVAAMSGCATLRQFAALGQVSFSFDRIKDVRLALVSTSGTNTYIYLRLEEVARITAAVATRKVPLEFLVQVRAENPSTNSVTARLLQLGWTLYLDESRILDGKLDRGYSFEPGKPVLVPIAVSLDAYELVGRSGGDLFDLALAIAGVEGHRKNVRLDLEPTVETDLGPIPYPSPITIRRDVGRGTD